MELSEWASIAEIVGAIAVVGTLIYVGLEVRGNSVSLRASASQAVSQSMTDITAMLASDPAMAQLWRKGVADFDSLTEKEEPQFSALMMCFARRLENAYFQNKLGILPAEQWDAYAAVCDRILQSGGGHAWWKNFGSQYVSSSFRKFVEDA